jgi:hypothetical protein
MKGRLFVSFAVLALAATSANAQGVDTKSCPPGNVGAAIPDQTRAAQDACQKAIDLFQYMAPQLGTSITGGNATLGMGGSLGGLGHFSAGFRVNAVQGSLPQVQNVTPQVTGATNNPAYDTKTQILPMPTAELAIGILKGIPLAITNVGGVDLLVSASYLPEFTSSNVTVKVPNGSLKLGYGARVGILQESLLVPGVSVSYLHRELPTVSIAANSNSDSLYVNNLSLKSNAWRVVASKGLLLFGFAAGFGQDKYESSTDISAHVAARALSPAANAGPVSLSQTITRTNVFGDLSLNLLLFKLTGEIGQVSGGTINTYNKFNGTQAADSRIYGSVGARFGF